LSAFILAVDLRAAQVDAHLDEAERALAGFATVGWRRVSGLGFAGSSSGLDETRPYAAERLVFLDGTLSVRCRADLRASLAALLQSESSSDHALVVAAWSSWGAAAAQRLEGDFALAVFDCAPRQLWLMRSSGSARGLYFVVDDHRIFLATRPGAALHLAGRALRESPNSIAAFFALRAPPPGACYFEGVSAVVAGALHSFSPQDHKVRESIPTKLISPLRFSDDIEAGAAWRATLVQAVTDALAAARQPGVMLSGGLDSSTLAALSKSADADLRAYSWRLPATPSSDECEWIEATCRHLDIDAEFVVGDADLPLARLSQWPVEDDGPPSNPYRWLQQHVFAVAAKRGCDTLITGNFGDHLYPAESAWLRSACADRGWAWSARELLGVLRHRGANALWRDPGWRAMLRGATGSPSWKAPDWMQSDCIRMLYEVLGRLPPSARADSAEALQDAELGRRFHCLFGIELVAPYRDPRVIDFAAALPAHYQYRHGQSKWLTREIMRGALPEAVRSRPKAGSLAAFFRKGVLDRSAAEVAALLDAADARWPQYVAPEALRRARENAFTEADLLLIWLCLSYELWWRAHWGSGPAVLASRVNRGDFFEAFRD
jgi:asparagine synthase (glutamine-hydrolysing)